MDGFLIELEPAPPPIDQSRDPYARMDGFLIEREAEPFTSQKPSPHDEAANPFRNPYSFELTSPQARPSRPIETSTPPSVRYANLSGAIAVLDPESPAPIHPESVFPRDFYSEGNDPLTFKSLETSGKTGHPAQQETSRRNILDSSEGWTLIDSTYPPNPEVFPPTGWEDPRFVKGPGAFDLEVAGTAMDIAKSITIPKTNPIARRAFIGFAAEENQAIKDRGFWRMVDFYQDEGAKWGFTTNGLLKDGPDKPVREPFIPVEYAYGTPRQKLLKQRDVLRHDIGPANINLLTALKTAGIERSADAPALARSLTTNEGSGLIGSRIAETAYFELSPFLNDYSEREQTQLLINYIRKGSKKFWNDVKNRRGMTDAEIEAWKADPGGYRLPNGKRPKPLEPTKIEDKMHRQIEAIERLAPDYHP